MPVAADEVGHQAVDDVGIDRDALGHYGIEYYSLTVPPPAAA